MEILLFCAGLLHLLAHVVPSVTMIYMQWHMHKFHGKAKWKVLAAVGWLLVSLLTLYELPDMIRSLSHHC